MGLGSAEGAQGFLVSHIAGEGHVLTGDPRGRRDGGQGAGHQFGGEGVEEGDSHQDLEDADDQSEEQEELVRSKEPPEPGHHPPANPDILLFLINNYKVRLLPFVVVS